MSAIRLRPWQKRGDIFLVWRPEHDETEDDAREVEANDEETAAEDWAEHDDRGGDYTIIGGSEATVCVRRKDGGETYTFVVTGESVPQYSARRLP